MFCHFLNNVDFLMNGKLIGKIYIVMQTLPNPPLFNSNFSSCNHATYSMFQFFTVNK
jgi:hypothetical protein